MIGWTAWHLLLGGEERVMQGSERHEEAVTKPDPLLVVKGKTGEMEAVLKTEIGQPVDIIIELLGSTGPVMPKIVKAGIKAAGEGHPLWLDATRLPVSSSLGHIPQGVLQHVDDQIEEGIRRKQQEQGSLDLFDAPGVLPVVSSDAGDKQLNEVRMLVEHKHRQVAVRCGPDSRIGSVPLIDQIERVAEVARVSTRDLHVLLDEVFIESTDERRALRLSAILSEVKESHYFASFGLIAGSTPQKRSDYSTHFRGRPEVELWESVQRQFQHPLRYGDYGVVHPRMVDSSGPPVQPNPHINYTVPGSSLSIARRVPGRGRTLPSGDAERYFIYAADELVNHEQFAGMEFSWGDRRFYWCRRDSNPTVGSSQKWIALATSHHLAHLSQRLDFPRES